MNAMPLQPHLFRIVSRTQETATAFSIEIEPNEIPSSPILAGQFHMLYVFGIGEVPISLSSRIGQHPLHTIKVVGKVTEALGRLQPGEWLGVRGPFGTPWPIEVLENKNVLLVAGGIGLAPLRPVIESLLETPSTVKSLHVLYGARDPSDLLFRSKLEEWKRQLPGTFYTTVDFAGTEWQGNVGTVCALIPLLDLDPNDSIAFICGPEIMIRFTLRELLQKGWKKESLFVSMERNMKCAIGHCGRCQYAPHFLCKDGPVLSYPKVQPFLEIKEV